MTKKDLPQYAYRSNARGFASVEARLSKMDGRFDRLDPTIERGFAAVADDLADVKRDMATKDQIIALYTQVNSIETELRGTLGVERRRVGLSCEGRHPETHDRRQHHFAQPSSATGRARVEEVRGE